MLGLLTMSVSTQYYQLILAEGVCSGLGSSAIFYAGVISVSKRFANRQAFAVGISASGTSLGGIIFPTMVTELLPRIGFAWTVRAVSLLILVLLFVSIATVWDEPQPQAPASSLTPRPSTNSSITTNGKQKSAAASSPHSGLVGAFSSPAFILTTLSAVLFSLGYFVTLILVVTVAQLRGMPNAVYSLVILNAASFPGRILPGAFADKFGRYNTMICLTFLSAALTLALYLPGTSVPATLAYCGIFGFTSASMVFLSPSLVYQITDNEMQIGPRIGVMYSFVGLAALVGSPIGGALLESGLQGLGPAMGARWLIVFCGVCQALGGLGFLGARCLLAGSKIRVKV